MAYAAVVSLMHTINHFSAHEEISVLESLRSKARALLVLLQEKSRAGSNALEAQIRDLMYETEDTIESHAPEPVESPLAAAGIFTRKLQLLLQEMVSIEMTLTATGGAGRKTIERKLTAGARSYPVVACKNKLVGLEDGLSRLKAKLIGESSRLNVVAVVGMAGIGKTTLVDRAFLDPSIGRLFHYRAWATVGPDHGPREVIAELLGPEASKFSQETSFSQLTEFMYRNLKGRKYLIVLDGLKDTAAWDDLKNLLPNDDNGSRVLVTTRLRKVALHAAGSFQNIHQMSFLGIEESWNLLRNIVFDRKDCPSEFLKVGKKIAENCQGLPLAIVLVATMLSGAEMILTYWQRVAESPISAIYDSHDARLKSAMQYLNDDTMPQHLKAFFMYMGLLPSNHEIPVSKLVRLWVSEGFVEWNGSESPEAAAEACLEELVDRSLVLVHKQRSTGGVKTCSVHSAVWHLCVNAAEKDGFFCAFTNYTKGRNRKASILGRRLCIRKNILLSIKDVNCAMSSVSKARSFLCSGLNHPYPLAVRTDFDLLRVLDVLTIRFYEFPNEILKLVQLRYLALTCGEIPASLSLLGKLQVLIVRRHVRIRSSDGRSCLPNEIWSLRHLRHLVLEGADLRDPQGTILADLSTLTKVSGRSCSEGVLRGTPNLKKLGVCIELVEEGGCTAVPARVFDRLALLDRLETLKCTVVNPSCRSTAVVRPTSAANFPHTLRKLTLRGCRFPWDDMRIVGRLPRLQVLKLGCCGFTGAVWEVDEDEFGELRFLQLEDLDLEDWSGGGLILKRLERLIVRHCYRMKEIPDGIDYIIYLQLVEVVDCSPSVLASALRIKDMQQDLSNDYFRLVVESSWKEKSSQLHAPFPN